jgi:hypothetical protein
LTDEFLLGNVNKLLTTAREYNVVTRWLLLHSCSTHKRLRDIVTTLHEKRALILNVMIRGAQFEFRLKTLIRQVLDRKPKQWTEYRDKSTERMRELCQYPVGDSTFTRSSIS